MQERIDRIAYPPTHTYRLAGLEPTGPLAERVAVIAAEFPGFFGGANRLLDVGCNKGFFALYHQGPVVGIDPDPECVDLCREVCPHGRFIVTTFGNFETTQEFDRIFIGNGPHYPFIEADGWGWVEKLAEMSCGQVLLEGPIDMRGRDAKACIPPRLAGAFTSQAMRAAFETRFAFRKQVRSPLVDRFFTLFERKDALFYDAARYPEYLIGRYRAMAARITDADVVLEIGTRRADRGALGRLLIAHRGYRTIDRDPGRPGQTLDAVTDDLPACDVTISTAVLHHTPPGDVRQLLANLARNTRRLMIFTGPNRAVMPELFGDHRYHLDVAEIGQHAEAIGWRLSAAEECGLSPPLCEVMVTLCPA